MTNFVPSVWWRVALAASGVFLFLGGFLHPRAGPNLPFDDATAEVLAHPLWEFSHVLLLASFAFLLGGLVGLVRSGFVAGTLRRVAWIAVLAVALKVVESIPHLAASADLDALLAGGATPLLDVYLYLSVISDPAVGVSVAALALLGGWRRELTHPLFGIVAAVGGVLYAFAVPIIMLTGDLGFSVLFMGGMLWIPWLLSVALRRRRAAADTDSTWPLIEGFTRR